MKKNLTLLFVAVVVLFSCTSNEKGFFGEDHILIPEVKEQTSIEPKLILPTDTLTTVGSIVAFNDGIIAKASSDCKGKVFSVYDSKGKHLGAFGTVGHANDEIVPGTVMVGQYDAHTLCLNSVNTAELKFVDVDKSLKEGRCIVTRTVPTAPRVINAFCLDDSTLLFEQETPGNYQLCERKIGSSEEKSQDMYRRVKDAFDTYRSFMAVNRNRKILVSAMQWLNQVNFTKLDGDSIYCKSVSLYADAQTPIEDEDKQMNYYTGITTTSKYVYALYMNQSREEAFDKEQPTEIHVFDWDGNFVKKLVANEYLYSITVNANDNAIYARDMEGNVYRYELK